MPTYAVNYRVVPTADSLQVTQHVVNAALRGIQRIPQPFIDALSFIRWMGADFVMPDAFLTYLYEYSWDTHYPSTMVVYSGMLPPGIQLENIDVTHGRLYGIPDDSIIPDTTYDFQLAVRSGNRYSTADFHITVREAVGGGGGAGGAGGERARRDVGEREVAGRGRERAETEVVHTAPTKVIKIEYRDQDITELVKRTRTAISRQENMVIVGPGVSKTKDGSFMINQ